MGVKGHLTGFRALRGSLNAADHTAPFAAMRLVAGHPRHTNAAVRASITGCACHTCCSSSSQHCAHFHSYRLVKYLLRPPVRGPCSEAPILISKGLHADQPLDVQDPQDEVRGSGSNPEFYKFHLCIFVTRKHRGSLSASLLGL